jgi:hypothetical protein
MLKGTHAALPLSSAVFLLMAQFREIPRHLLLGERMIIEVPPHGSDELPGDEQRKLTVLPYKPKATFHWPPDCLWPFMDHGPENET